MKGERYAVVIPRSLQDSPISEALELLEKGALHPYELIANMEGEGRMIDYTQLFGRLCGLSFAAYNKADNKLYPNRVLMEDPGQFVQMREDFKVFGSVGILAHPANYDPNGEFDFIEDGNRKPFRLSYKNFIELAKTEEGREWLEKTKDSSIGPFLTDMVMISSFKQAFVLGAD